MSVLLPIYLNLKDRECLVVGGGKVASRKVQSLVASEAKVRVVSPKITPELNEMKLKGEISWEQKIFETKDLGHPLIVICATDNEDINRKVAALCWKKNIPVNVVDDPPKCNFYMPAVVKRGELTIAISTGGKSPMLAACIRRQLEKQFGKEYEDYLELLGEIRKRVLSKVPDENKRREIFKRLVDSNLLELIRLGKDSEIKERIEECIYSW